MGDEGAMNGLDHVLQDPVNLQAQVCLAAAHRAHRVRHSHLRAHDQLACLLALIMPDQCHTVLLRSSSNPGRRQYCYLTLSLYTSAAAVGAAPVNITQHACAHMSCICYHSPQLYTWDFDVFKLERQSGGQALYSIAMALLEDHELLVRAGLFLLVPDQHF